MFVNRVFSVLPVVSRANALAASAVKFAANAEHRSLQHDSLTCIECHVAGTISKNVPAHQRLLFLQVQALSDSLQAVVYLSFLEVKKERPMDYYHGIRYLARVLR